MKLSTSVRTCFLILATVALSGCSYEYDAIAKKINGQLMFMVASDSARDPSCLRRIEISASDTNEVVWRASVDHGDSCANEFPITYGANLAGRSEPNWPTIAARKLSSDLVYDISTTSGSTGYGSGRFMIDLNGNVISGSELEAIAPQSQAPTM